MSCSRSPTRWDTLTVVRPAPAEEALAALESHAGERFSARALGALVELYRAGELALGAGKAVDLTSAAERSLRLRRWTRTWLPMRLRSPPAPSASSRRWWPCPRPRATWPGPRRPPPCARRCCPTEAEVERVPCSTAGSAPDFIAPHPRLGHPSAAAGGPPRHGDRPQLAFAAAARRRAALRPRNRRHEGWGGPLPRRRPGPGAPARDVCRVQRPAGHRRGVAGGSVRARRAVCRL